MKIRKKVTPETSLKTAAKDFLAFYRIWTFPLTAGLGSHPGAPDRMGIWEKGKCPHCGGKVPQPMALEFKKPKGYLSEPQKAFRKDWEERGGLYVPIWKIEDLAAGLGIKTLGLI